MKTRRILALLLCVCVIIPMLSIFSYADNENVGEHIMWWLNPSTNELVIRGYGDMYNYSISKLPPWTRLRPDKITFINDGGQITSIGDYAFYNFYGQGIQNITIPDSIKSIGSHAFYGSDVETINLGTGLETIKDDAFGKSAITKLNIPDNVKTIGELLCYEAKDLKSLKVGNGVKDIPRCICTNCAKLETVVLGNSVETIVNNAFDSCTKLSQVTLSNSLKKIDAMAFYKCTSLKSIILPEGLEKISGYAFEKSGLESIVIPNSVKQMTGCFKGCTSLRNAVIGDNLLTLSNHMFDGCTALTNVTLGQNIRVIDDEAFLNCTSLKSLYISETVENIGEYAIGYNKSDENYIKADDFVIYGDAITTYGPEAYNYATKNGFKYVANKPSITGFDDVPGGVWYEKAVAYCVEKGYFSGTSKTTFSPILKLTREQFMQVLFNFAKADKNLYLGETGFSDVPAGEWYSPAVKWAKDNNITTGIGGGLFGLGVEISREQFAALLMNYASGEGKDVKARANIDAYTDKGDVSSWALDGIRWAVAEGLMSGTTPTTLSPLNIADRATATMLFKNFDIYFNK